MPTTKVKSGSRGWSESSITRCLYRKCYRRMRDILLVCILIVTFLNTLSIYSLRETPPYPNYRRISSIRENDNGANEDGLFMSRIYQSRDHLDIDDKFYEPREEAQGIFHDNSRDHLNSSGKFKDSKYKSIDDVQHKTVRDQDLRLDSIGKIQESNDKFKDEVQQKTMARDQDLKNLKESLPVVKSRHEELVIYNVKFNRSKSCKSMNRPNPKNVPKYKGYYHYFADMSNDSSRAYVLNTYYDDRLRGTDGIFIRTVAASTFDLVKRTIFMAVWYLGVTESLFSKCQVFLGPGPNAANGALYGFRRFTISCPIPDQRLIMPPEFASLSVGRCREPTNYIPVVVPAPKDQEEPFKIGNCMQSLYGNFTDEFALMFVNWIETITMYGISEVTVNLNEFNNTVFGEKVLQHYKDKGILTVTEYPDIVPEDTTVRKQTVAKIQSFIMLPFVDCFFKNMYRYWYFAPLDVDELFVINPKYQTYQDYLRRYLFSNAEQKNSIYLSTWVAGYYLNYRPANLKVPKHFPMFRYTKRDELKAAGNAGHKKSFQNPKTCIYAGYHACRPLKQEDLHCPTCGYRQVMLPPDEIVLNHYRPNCKIVDVCLNPKDAILDEGVLAGTTGKTIKERVTLALTELGYLKS